MRLRIMLGLATVIMSIGFAGTSSAAAESTALCTYDPMLEGSEVCESPSLITHVHERSILKGRVLVEGLPTVECTVLFLGEVSKNEKNEYLKLASPLVIRGSYTYSSCNNFCSVKEENGPSKITLLMTEFEAASVISQGLVHINCPFINCSYTNGIFSMEGSAKGFLTSGPSTINGEVTFKEKLLEKEAGGEICPTLAELDLTTEPLQSTFITK